MKKILAPIGISLFLILLITQQTTHVSSSSSDPLPQNLFIKLAQVVNPAVVSVSISFQQHTLSRGYPQNDPFFYFLEEFFGPNPNIKKYEKKQKARPVGTGFIIESNGLAVTNNHVIEMADEIEVQLQKYPNKSFSAKVIGRDPKTDVALIQIETKTHLPTLKLGSSEKVQVGEWVAAFGNPYGHTFSMSKGIVSAKGRHIDELNIVPFLQTDASINPGNSGGPLVNTHGQVIGVNTAIDARAQGIGFAIPIDYVKELIPQLKKFGRVRRGHIGVSVNNVNPRVQSALGLPVDYGTVIMDISPHSPAEKSGLKPYDVIVKFNNKKIENFHDLSNTVAVTPVGKEVPITIFREGVKRTLRIKVGENQIEVIAKESRENRRPKKKNGLIAQAGLKIINFNHREANRYRLPKTIPRRPIVIDVMSNSPAARSGIRRGDVILDVNKKAVKSVSHISKQLRKGLNMLKVQNAKRVSLIFMTI